MAILVKKQIGVLISAFEMIIGYSGRYKTYELCDKINVHKCLGSDWRVMNKSLEGQILRLSLHY